MDNYHFSPVAQAAFAWLVASPALRKQVRAIGLSAAHWLGATEATLDASIPMPFTVEMLLEAIEAQRGGPD